VSREAQDSDSWSPERAATMSKIIRLASVTALGFLIYRYSANRPPDEEIFFDESHVLESDPDEYSTWEPEE